MPQTLTQMKSLLHGFGLHPKHRFGQNFLHDHNKIAAIVAAADVQPGELIVEVGPGTGTLSLALLEAGARLLAVEIDSDLIPILENQFDPFRDRVQLLNCDVLESKNTIAPQVLAAIGNAPFKLIANLPYNVASPLLANLVVDHPHMSLAVVMIQREVADRLRAKPGGKDYGPLGIMIQTMCTTDIVTTLPPTCFWPAPKVESAVIRLRRRDKPLTEHPASLARLLQTLFQKRRKQIGSILGRDHPLPPGINPTMRPEQLTVQQLIELSR